MPCITKFHAILLGLAAAEVQGSALKLVGRLDALLQKSHASTSMLDQTMGTLQDLARAELTPGVVGEFTTIVGRLNQEVETRIRDGHTKTQEAIDNTIADLENTTTAAVNLKMAADMSDNDWYECVASEKSLLHFAEVAAEELKKANEAVIAPCKLQEDRDGYAWDRKSGQLAFECDISIHDNCDSQLQSYNSQIDHMVLLMKNEVQEAGELYAQAKAACDSAKATVVRKKANLDNAVQDWEKQRSMCQTKDTTRKESMCSFGVALQKKCAVVTAHTTLLGQIDSTGNPNSELDRIQEWKVAHTTKCQLTKAINGQPLDEGVFRICSQSANYAGDVGKLDRHSKTFDTMTSGARFTCIEKAISFKGVQWIVPTGDNSLSSEYISQTFVPAVTLVSPTAPFQFC
jgi:hypothetical protein